MCYASKNFVYFKIEKYFLQYLSIIKDDDIISWANFIGLRIYHRGWVKTFRCRLSYEFKSN
jgi:hypothetical protein